MEAPSRCSPPPSPRPKVLILVLIVLIVLISPDPFLGAWDSPGSSPILVPRPLMVHKRQPLIQ